MSQDSEAIVKRLSFSHWGGQAAGFGDSAAFLEKKAGEAFLAKKDGLANALREISDQLKEKAAEARVTQKKYKES